MSKINISENLFLETAELKRLINFLDTDGWKRAVKTLVTKFGIVKDENNTQFKVTAQGTDVVINPGLAFTTSMEAIVLKNARTLSMLNIIDKAWIIISRSTTNYEEGTVNLGATGGISGNNTLFTQVLRGQPNFPTKVAFESSLNTGEYEVVNVVNDTSATVVGNFTPENNIRYKVIGTFTPGFNPAEANKYIYEYDDCEITVIDSPSKPLISTDEYLVACVYMNSGSLVVEDYRIYNMLNYEYKASEIHETGVNPLVALLNCNYVSGKQAVGSVSMDVELIAEHGYKINNYSLNYGSTSTTFTITNGMCSVYGRLYTQNNVLHGSIPNDAFNDWLLLNRANMKTCKIDKNVNNVLYISMFDTSIVESAGNDFVIIPDFDGIEYQVTVSNNVVSTDSYRGNERKFFFRESIENIFSRLRFYIMFPETGTSYANNVTVDIRYRMIDAGSRYNFNGLAATEFKNIKGESEILGNSDFDINVAELKPIAEIRNYS